MSLVATDNGSGGDFTPAPQGTHTARCVRVIDLGTQPGSQMYPAPKHKVMVGWELPEEMREYDGKQEPATDGNSSRTCMPTTNNGTLRLCARRD